jgi:sec-independent protein translocase protein TatB
VIGLTADKLLLIAVLVAFLFGPERLPHLAERLGSAVRTFRGHLTSTEQRMRDELRGDIDVNDWKKLDPRQYDPRTIIRDAFTTDTSPAAAMASDRGTAAVLDGSSDRGQQDAPHGEDDLRPDPSAEPEMKQVFRRRSDGHVQLVTASAPAEESGSAAGVPDGS